MADDLPGGAPAPAESTPASDAPSNTPAPIAEASPRGAIDRAFAAVDGDAPPVEKTKPAPVQEPVAGQDRNPDGTFKAKDPAAAPQPAATAAKPDPGATEAPKIETPAGEAPARFSADAKAAWASVPDPVKAEVARMEREQTAGIEKYRADATAYETFKPFAEMAVRSNVDPAKQLASYVNIDLMLAKDFDKGIATIFQNKGISPREWAARIMGQPAPTPVPQDQLITELRNELADVKRGLGGVSQTIEQQRSHGISQSLESFTAALPEADQSLFKELDAEIAAHLRDPQITLAQAFERAKQDAEARYTRMFGARASSAPAAVQPPPATAPKPQTLPGTLSVSGAPGSGSNPASRKTPSSPRAALDDAFASLGIG